MSCRVVVGAGDASAIRSTAHFNFNLVRAHSFLFQSPNASHTKNEIVPTVDGRSEPRKTRNISDFHFVAGIITTFRHKAIRENGNETKAAAESYRKEILFNTIQQRIEEMRLPLLPLRLIPFHVAVNFPRQTSVDFRKRMQGQSAAVIIAAENSFAPKKKTNER